ncbi:nodulation efficiency, NfeD-like protein [Larsenimonas suaedae]|uniref:Nodulation efficiency, NfeD-like protein n=1 Tax=Larsenimonas suaedae TaxID=1851019 RepID=A0ABU1GRT8_9GAMM|nr:nodulation efficiency, NfeD-like protein [Larsenimonas suaedae]MCM2972461.1 nodulation efficiency, NfeD-like protein [Larsenimonas suaedae]MDR5894743.1 nodulation efficiency, NfeD-like protein [Larsenimonas suaedae]
MAWTDSWVWGALALILALLELVLGAGAFVFLALAAAALGGALLALFGATLIWQLAGVGVLAGILVPVSIKRIGHHTSPKAMGYGTTGTGVEQGYHFITEPREFDQTPAIKIKGDTYRVRDRDAPERPIPMGMRVRFDHFEGTTAIVVPDPVTDTLSKTET